MATLPEQRATLAEGRRLTRIATWMLYATTALMLAGIAAVPLLTRAGWLKSGYASPAVIVFFGLILAGFGVMTVPATAGWRRIKYSVAVVAAADPDREVPETLRIRSARSWRWTAVRVVLAAGTMVFVVSDRSISQWLISTLAIGPVLFEFVRVGPSGFEITSAQFGRFTIWLPQLGIDVPWSSVSHVEANAYRVRIGIPGPVARGGDLPEFWVRRAIRRVTRRGRVDLRTDRQEDVAWLVRRHLTAASRVCAARAAARSVSFKVFPAPRSGDSGKANGARDHAMKPRRSHAHQCILADAELSRGDPGGRSLERWQPYAADSVLRNDCVEAAS